KPPPPAPPPPQVEVPPAAPVATSPESSAPIATDGPSAPNDPLTPQETKRRERALVLLDQGKLADAHQILSALLEVHPSNAPLRPRADGVAPLVKGARGEASKALVNVPATRLARPPFQYTLRTSARLGDAGPAPKLVKLSEQKNQITDEEEWFARN